MKRGTPAKIFAALILLAQVAFIVRVIYDNASLTAMELLLKYPLIWILHVIVVVTAYKVFEIGDRMDK